MTYQLKSKKTRRRRGLLARGRKMTEKLAERIIQSYYRDDPKGLESDMRITVQRGETIIQWAEQLLDGV